MADNWYGLGDGGGVVSWITDGLGLTDTGAGGRAVDTLNKQTNKALDKFDTGVADALSGWSSLGTDPNDPLSKVRGDLETGASRVADSGVTPDSASAWLNPKLDLMQDAAARSLGMGGAGTASNNAVAQKVAMLGAGEYDKAQQAAFTNSANEQNIGKTTADIYQQQFENNMLPMQTMTQAGLDSSTARLNAATNAAAGAGQLAGQNRSIFGAIFG